MSKGSLTILPDRSLTVEKHPGEDTAAMEAALSAFVELGPATETQRHYQITAASIWRARRQGLSLAEILHTLETYSQSEIPAKVRADLMMWSTQIDRLTLEVDRDGSSCAVTIRWPSRPCCIITPCGRLSPTSSMRPPWKYGQTPIRRWCTRSTPRSIPCLIRCRREGTCSFHPLGRHTAAIEERAKGRRVAPRQGALNGSWPRR
jgi:hypothetical protein